jgi:type IV secretory pathway TraG/TraD family ATPase VirD4
MVLLSKSGAGSGSALLTALVRGICRNAERAAERNGGRLPVPLVMELDECANTVQWPELPTVYSYYGSLDTYFQSRAQGQNAFGKEGWQALWDAASIRVFVGGSGDDDSLRSLSTLIGEHDEHVNSTSYTPGRRESTSTSTRKVATLGVKQLAALPEWRAIVFPSKLRPVIVQTRPWFRDKHLTTLITGGLTR